MICRALLFLLLASCLLLLSSCASEDIFPTVGNSLANPISIAIDSAANRAYVVSSNNKVFYDTGSLQILDISTPASPVRAGVAELPNFSGQTYLDSANGYLYITNRLSSDNNDTTDSLLRMNINEASADFLVYDSYAASSNPFGVAFDVASGRLYVATRGNALDYYSLASISSPTSISLASISLSDGSALSTSPVSEATIFGTQAFLSRTSGGVLVMDLSEGNIDYAISDISSPRGIASDGTYIYVVDADAFYVLNPAILPAVTGNTTAAVIDKDDSGIVAYTIGVGTDPQEVVVGQNNIFVSNMGADTVSVISKATYTKTTDITVGDEPFGMAIYSPAGVDTHLFVTNIQSGSVSVIDLASLTVAGTYQ